MWEKVRKLPSVEESKEFKPPGYGVDHQWTKQSIFWELPYWKIHLLPHNLDVMHIERSVFLNILFTVMDIKGKTKDTFNTRRDLKKYCKQRGLELQPSSNDNFVKAKAQH